MRGFCIDDICSEDVVLLVGALAIAIAEGKSSDEVDNLGNFFSALGQNLSTIAGTNRCRIPEDCK